MSGAPTTKALLAISVTALILVGLILVGNFTYWRGEGSPGTPSDFRERVAETGIQVAWANVGPRGGDGTVETNCGTTTVAVREIDANSDVLWLFWGDQRVELTSASLQAFQACSGP